MSNDALLSKVLGMCPDDRDKSRIMSCTVPHSGDWLSCTPLKALGLSMSPDEFRVAINYILGIAIFNHNEKCLNVLQFLINLEIML